MPRQLFVIAVTVAGLLLAAPPPKVEAQTLKAVMHSDLKIIDPIWTTALISLNHGYMVYDTLFSVDEKLAVKPQMIDTWTISDDKKTWTLKLRDGLAFHDGAAVTSDDVIASLKRWGARDTMGQKLVGLITVYMWGRISALPVAVSEQDRVLLLGLAGFFAMAIAIFVATQPTGPPALVTFLPAFWLLVPGAIGLLGVTEVIVDPRADGLATLLSTGVAIIGIALGVLVGLGVSKVLGADRDHDRLVRPNVRLGPRRGR